MTDNGVKSRLLLLDRVKLLASFFVVFIHCHFYGYFGVAVKAASRFAVPFFFLCSGYFLYNNEPAKIRNKLFHILRLYLASLAVYILYDAAKLFVEGDSPSVIDYLHSFWEINTVLKWLLFNEHSPGVHLWYLHAMIYVYSIHYFIAKKRIPDRLIFGSSVVLICLHLLIWHLLLTFRSTAFVPSTFLVRNFFFSGYPMVGLGMLLRKYQTRIPVMKGSTLLFIVAIGTALSIASRTLVGDKSVPLGAILVASSLLIYSIQPHPDAKLRMRKAGLLSTYIYILHPIVISSVGFLASRLGVPSASILWMNVKPFIVCFVSMVAAWFIVALENCLRIHSMKRIS